MTARLPTMPTVDRAVQADRPEESPRRPLRSCVHEIPYSTRPQGDRSLTGEGALTMQRLVRPQRNLAPRDMTQPGHANRHALAGQPDRPGVAAMTAPGN